MNKHILFSFSEYPGHESEVLHILNNNRIENQTKNYLNWRYLGDRNQKPPVICWIHGRNNEKIGMSSLIFRSYYINDKSYDFAVRGDTSLNKEFRGKGLGKDLFIELRQYIDKNSIPCIMAMSNTAAEKASVAAGYTIEDSLVPFVYIRDITEKILPMVKYKWLSGIIGCLYKKISDYKLNKVDTSNLNILDANEFDQGFEILWKTLKLKKPDYILRNRNQKNLDWRYRQHPNMKFHINKIMKNDIFIGYIIYTISQENNECKIYDFIVLENQHIRTSISLFIRKLIDKCDIASIRILLNEKHPYSGFFEKAEYKKRKKDGVLITYFPEKHKINESLKWFITQGDKDI